MQTSVNYVLSLVDFQLAMMDGIGFEKMDPWIRLYDYWLKLAMVIFGICLYSADIGSDILVGADLIQRCHNQFAASVFSFTIMPGFVVFLILICGKAFEDGCSWKIFLVLLAPLGAPLAGILFIPYGLYLLIRSAIKLDSSDRADHAKM